jgi:hypothetical protein
MQVQITYCCRTLLTTPANMPYADPVCSVCGNVLDRDRTADLRQLVKASVTAAGVALGLMSDFTRCLAHDLDGCPTHMPQFQQAVTSLITTSVLARDVKANNALRCVAHKKYLQNCPTCQATIAATAPVSS